MTRFDEIFAMAAVRKGGTAALENILCGWVQGFDADRCRNRAPNHNMA